MKDGKKDSRYHYIWIVAKQVLKFRDELWLINYGFTKHTSRSNKIVLHYNLDDKWVISYAPKTRVIAIAVVDQANGDVAIMGDVSLDEEEHASTPIRLYLEKL